MAQSGSVGKDARSRVAQQVLEDPDTSLSDLIMLLADPANTPQDDRSLELVGSSIRTVLLSEAVEDAGVDLDDPSPKKQLYLPDDGLLVIDLKDRL